MELFLPSFLVLLLTAAIVLGILPRISPFIIFVLCTVFLFISVRTHYSMFSNDYKNFLTLDFLQANAYIILVGLIVLGVLIAVTNFYAMRSLPSSLSSLPSLSSLITPKLGNSKVISSRQNYTNIPLERLASAERQF